MWRVKSISPTSGKKGENEGELFHKKWNLCETGGGNEREFCFHNKFQLHSTVPVMSSWQIQIKLFIYVAIACKFSYIN